MLYITVLFILLVSMIPSTIAAPSNPVIPRIYRGRLSPETTTGEMYRLAPVWETSVNLSYTDSLTVQGDYDGDGVADLVVYGWMGQEPVVAVLDAVNGSIIGSITLNTTPGFMLSRIVYAGDNDGDGYAETVFILYTYNYTTNTTTYMFISWEPYTGEILASGTYNITSTTTPFTASGASVGDGVVSIAASIVDLSTTPPSTYTVIINYNVLTGETTSSTINGKIYDILSNQNTGDFDDDGVMEFDTGYKVIAYTEFNIFQGGLVSTVEVYHSGSLLFSKTLPTNNIPFAYLIDYTNGELVVEFTSIQVDLLTNTTYLNLYAYSGTGSLLYSHDFGKYAYPIGFTVSNGYSAITYISGEDNKTHTAFYDAATGDILWEYAASIFLPPNYLPLGVANGETRLFMRNGTQTLILDIPSFTRHFVVNAGNYSLTASGAALEVPSGNGTEVYIPAARISMDSTIIGAYTLVSAGFNDTTPPVIEFYYPSNQSLVGRTITAVASVQDIESGIAGINVTLTDLYTGASRRINYNYDPTLGVLTAKITFNHTGEYMLTITAENGAGMKSNGSVVFTADAEPPVIQVYSPANNTVITPGDFPLTLHFSVSDDTGVMFWYVAVNGEIVNTGFTGGEFRVSLPISSFYEGVNNVTIFASDPAGNSVNKTLILVFRTTPVLNLTIRNEEVLEGFLEGNVTLDLYFTGYVSMPCSFQVLIDSSIAYNSSISIGVDENVTINTSAYADGEHSLEIRASCGNMSMTLYSRTIYIDNHPPVLNVSLPGLLENGVLDVSSIQVVDGKAVVDLELNVSDPYLVGIYVYVDGVIVWSRNTTGSATASWIHLLDVSPLLSESGNNGTQTVPVTLSQGKHYIEVLAVDKAGHNSSVGRSVIVDLTPPSIEEFNVVGGPGTVDVTWQVYDNISGIYKVVVALDGMSQTFYWKTTGGTSFSDLSPGTYNVTITVYDQAGNYASESRTVTVTQQFQNTTTTTTPSGGASTTTPTTTTPHGGGTTQTTREGGGAGAAGGGGGSGALTYAVAAVVIVLIAAAAYFVARRR